MPNECANAGKTGAQDSDLSYKQRIPKRSIVITDRFKTDSDAE
jgi:hypothetical protein